MFSKLLTVNLKKKKTKNTMVKWISLIAQVKQIQNLKTVQIKYVSGFCESLLIVNI